ncbi:unnamed protein product [Closterium sp. NIES-54]
MESELKSIEENGTWELVELPEGRKAITSKWLFKIKSDADGNIERYKSRLVAKGYQQKEKPEGFDDGSGRVWKLKKALYGLKQAPRQWYLKLREVLEEIGLTPSSADHSLFMLGEGEQRSFMVVYVDDILIFSPSSDLVKEVMLKLQDKFKCKALGDVSFYLGLHIERDVEKRCMRVHQQNYLEALGANFGKSEGGAGAGGAGVVGLVAGGAGAEGAVSGGTGAGGTVRPRTYFVPLLQQVLGVPSSPGLPPPLRCPPPDHSQPMLHPASALPTPSPYIEQVGGLTERCVPPSRPASPICTGCRVPCLRPFPVPSTHAMTLRPSSVPMRVLLPTPPESSLPTVPDPESDRARAACPIVSSLLATIITNPLFESTATSALVAELVDFAVACRLDYATALVAESECASPRSVGGEFALGTDILEDRQKDFESLVAAVPRFASMLLALEGDLDIPDIPIPRSYAEAITGPYSSQWQAAMDAEMASWNSTSTWANIVDGMWIFMVKRPLGSPPAFKARYVARGFRQRQGVDYFQNFFPTPKMTTLWVLLHVAAQRDYELHSLDFSTQWSLRRPVYGLRQTPCVWHNTLRITLVALGFTPSTVDPSLFLRTDTYLPLFYFLMYVDDLVFATADTEALTLLKSELQKRHTCTDLGELRSYLGFRIIWDRARRTITLTQSHMAHHVLQRFGFPFSSPQPSPLFTSYSVSVPHLDESVEPNGPYPELVGCLISSCEAEIYAGAMAAQELRWLTYLLTDLGEQPRSPPILYVDNKAMIALCHEHRPEHRTKHIALRYFLARELQQRGQLRLAYVATQANTADVFTKALPPGDHQRFTTLLGLVPTLPHLLTA